MWLDDNDTLIHSTYNECKLVVLRGLRELLKVKSIKKWHLIAIDLILVIWINEYLSPFYW